MKSVNFQEVEGVKFLEIQGASTLLFNRFYLFLIVFHTTIKSPRPPKGTSCSLSLPNKDVADDDIVRVVFSCKTAPPTSGETPVWGEEVKQTNNGNGGNSGGGNVPPSKEGNLLHHRLSSR